MVTLDFYILGIIVNRKPVDFFICKSIATAFFDLIQNVSNAIIYILGGFSEYHRKQFVLRRSLLQIRFNRVFKMVCCLHDFYFTVYLWERGN